MLKASNNHFGDRSKIKIPKIRPFAIQKVQKSQKNGEKYFQRQFWKVWHAKNIIKVIPNERGDQTHLLHIYYFCFLRMPHLPKLTQFFFPFF